MSKENGKPIRIIGLKAENVKRLKAVSLDTNRTLIKVEGKNAAGKSSLLDAIMYALGGGKVLPDKPIRDGQKKASVTLDLGELTVERRWTVAGGTTLIVKTKDGVQQASPQAILDKLTSDLMFDPLKFAGMSPTDQSNTLKKLAGLDFTEMDKKRSEFYTERTLVNRELKNAEANVGQVLVKPKSMAPVGVSDLANKQQEANTNNRKIDDIEAEIARAKLTIDTYKQEISTLQVDIKLRNETIDERKALLKTMSLIDVTDFNEKILEAEENNRRIEAYIKYDASKVQVKSKQDESDSLTRQIDGIDDEKSRLLLEAKFPLDGIGIDESGPTLDGIPFSQASLSQRLRMGVAIGLAEKKRARIVLIHDGSLLDEDSMKDLNDILEEYDAQCFVEIVSGSPSESAVYIENGEVVEVPE